MKTPMRVVIDISRGSLYYAYAPEPFEVILISNDPDDVANAPLSVLAPEGHEVAIYQEIASTAARDVALIDHYFAALAEAEKSSR